MAKKTDGDDPFNSCLPFARLGAPAGDRATATVAEPPQTLDALALVDLCRLLDVPVGLGVATLTADNGTTATGQTASADMSGHDMDRALKRELLELNRAYTRIPDGNVRRTLLQLVKAAAGPH